ncbi:MAG: polysaccharide deacetylase family protein [Chitinophagales bacterium]
MLLIYSPKITNRLRYIFEHIFEDMLGLSFSITTDKEIFIAFEGAKMNYSSRQFEDELFFYTSPLLFERGIKQQRIKVEDFEDTKIFYICRSNSDLPFDPFAASFYLISRYEEYLPSTLDQHGRFDAKNSLAYKNNFLQQPLIDKWVFKLKDCLKKHYPSITFRLKKYKFLPSYDIDIAYSYINKGILRNFGGYLIDVKNLNLQRIKNRTKVLFGLQKDPYDTYNWQLKLQKTHNLQPLYFFLVGEYGAYDKNISIESFSYQDLIQSIGDVCEVGIHPSYASNKNLLRLTDEVKALAKVLKKEIHRSRQHYIKLQIPETYQNLIDLDITKDYSMGYASELGFRASTASAFLFYDLTLEIKTKLKIYPFAVMDVTLKDYLKLTPEASIEKLQELIEEIRSVEGLFISIWHNNTLSDAEDWTGWRKVYEEMVKEAVKNG